MDKAQINAEEVLDQQKLLLGQAKKTDINMALLETSASLMNFKEEEV